MYILERSMECLPQAFSYLDDELCQSLKDLQSPPVKAGFSKGDQLSLVSDMLLENQDMQLNWNCALFHSDDEDDGGGGRGRAQSPAVEESGEDSLWRCLASDKSLEEMLSDMDGSIFDGLVGSTLDCQNLLGGWGTGEVTSDSCSTGGDASTYSSSDSEEEIDVVTVGRSPSRQQQQHDDEDEQRVALQRQLHFDIQLQHNYAALPPMSPPASSSNKHSRHHHHHSSSRHLAETEDEEERRRTHNVMERQRRNELKNCFVRLRDNVPELSRNDKASKAVILKKARDCIHSLEEHDRRLRAKRDRLGAKQEQLKARLRQLRRPVRW